MVSYHSFSHLQCPECKTEYDPLTIQSYCIKDNQPLIAQYKLNGPTSKKSLLTNDQNMWRYKAFLPVRDERNIVTLGEGLTPMIRMTKIPDLPGTIEVFIKDEGQNPTGSFKSRGISTAVSMAKELGIEEIAIPTAGNAGSALSAYCARAGLKAHVFMPRETPNVFIEDCQITGADVRIIDGNISDCAKAMQNENADNRWFDMSTMKEPYRLEGKKTMGYEIAEQLNWKLPDWIIYPTGGGTGLIGIWKAFQEMHQMGWIEKVHTRMVAIQTDGCRPIVDAFTHSREESLPYPDPSRTVANGLRVPHAFGNKLILKTLYESNGMAISVTDDDIMNGIREVAECEGLFLSPEGAAAYCGFKRLQSDRLLRDGELAIILNTGSAYKYMENMRFD